MKQKIKNHFRRHKGKHIAGASVMAMAIAALTFWSNMAPVVCPMIPNSILCANTGAVAKAGAEELGKLDSVVIMPLIEEDGGTP